MKTIYAPPSYHIFFLNLPSCNTENKRLIYQYIKPLPTTPTCINCLGDSKKILASKNTPKFQKLIKNILAIIEENFI